MCVLIISKTKMKTFSCKLYSLVRYAVTKINKWNKRVTEVKNSLIFFKS